MKNQNNNYLTTRLENGTFYNPLFAIDGYKYIVFNSNFPDVISKYFENPNICEYIQKAFEESKYVILIEEEGIHHLSFESLQFHCENIVRNIFFDLELEFNSFFVELDNLGDDRVFISYNVLGKKSYKDNFVKEATKFSMVISWFLTRFPKLGNLVFVAYKKEHFNFTIHKI